MFYDRPDVQLWSYEFEFERKKSLIEKLKSQDQVEYEKKLNFLLKQYPSNKADVKHNLCRRAISESLVKDIHFVWIEMLLASRYSRSSSMGRDGVTYHFSGRNYFFEEESDDLKVLMRFNGAYSAQVWSPEPNTKTGLLVEISDLLVDYCLKPDEGKIAKLLKKKVNLLKERI